MSPIIRMMGKEALGSLLILARSHYPSMRPIIRMMGKWWLAQRGRSLSHCFNEAHH